MLEAMDDHEKQELMRSIRACFPDEARATDAWMAERGFEGAHSWLESFADRTTEAVLARDAALVAAHTNLLAHHYLQGSPGVQKLIDVSYAEPLMWNASPEDKCWAWAHIAGPVRLLHEQMWGRPHC